MPEKRQIITVPLEQIIFDTTSKVRAEVDRETIDRYKDLWDDYLEKVKEYEASPPSGKPAEKPRYPFPLCKAANRPPDDAGFCYDCVSGQHRVTAARQAGITELRMELVEGTKEELLLIAVQENRKHGRANSPNDLKQCIAALKQSFPDYTYRQIADLVGCSKTYVGLVLADGTAQKSKTTSDKINSRSGRSISPARALAIVKDRLDKFPIEVFDELEKLDNKTADSAKMLAIDLIKRLARDRSIKALQKTIAAIKSK